MIPGVAYQPEEKDRLLRYNFDQSACRTTELPIVIASKPEAVHILVGAHELEGSPADPTAETGAVPLGNIVTMVNMLKAANIPVVVGNMPPCPGINSGRINLAMEVVFTETYQPAEITGVPLIFDQLLRYSSVTGR